MIREISISVFIGILSSLFLFPFNPAILPIVNTKMALAAFGILLMLYNAATSFDKGLRLDLLKLTMAAILVSVIGFIAVTVNGTSDYTYATYIISMWVWLAGAYTVIYVMKRAYGRITFPLVANYLISVCIAQCILAQLIHYIPSVANFIDDIMVSTGFMGKMDSRLYGLGCALDVAGLKFSGVLIITIYLAIHDSEHHGIWRTIWYIFAFAVVTILGSMIARTTSIGAIVAITYLLLYSVFRWLYRPNNTEGIRRLWKTILCILLIIIPTCVILYRYVQPFREMFDFGFEGFISLAETGKWEVRSNHQLLAQWYWPDNLKTWIIGDGYFNSPDQDPYYIGARYEGYYKGTDVGWCRFIFYFGLSGLVSFMIFFVYAAYLCGKLYAGYKSLFWILVLMNFIGWNKVSSDIFPIFAIFIMAGGVASTISSSRKIMCNNDSKALVTN